MPGCPGCHFLTEMRNSCRSVTVCLGSQASPTTSQPSSHTAHHHLHVASAVGNFAASLQHGRIVVTPCAGTTPSPSPQCSLCLLVFSPCSLLDPASSLPFRMSYHSRNAHNPTPITPISLLFPVMLIVNLVFCSSHYSDPDRQCQIVFIFVSLL